MKLTSSDDSTNRNADPTTGGDLCGAQNSGLVLFELLLSSVD